MKVVEKNKRQYLQKVPSLWLKQIFVYFDENFAINWNSNFPSPLLMGKFRRGVAESFRLKKLVTSVEYTVIQRLCIE